MREYQQRYLCEVFFFVFCVLQEAHIVIIRHYVKIKFKFVHFFKVG